VSKTASMVNSRIPPIEQTRGLVQDQFKCKKQHGAVDDIDAIREGASRWRGLWVA
jgi:hypothetical protein